MSVSVKKNADYHCVIMAGGIGSRFWPLSRNHKPKQFLDILGTGKTFIRATYERFTRIIPKENFWVVTGNDYGDLVSEQIPEIDKKQILCEPLRRNTAPCIAYATYKILQNNPNAKVVVTPSDHLILNEQNFLEVMLNSLDFAGSHDALVTIGLKPSRPEIGYGYIQVDEKKDKICRDTICKVKTFTEKPNLETAKLFVQSGEFYWNSGIFIWGIQSIKKALEENLPDIASAFAQGGEIYNTAQEAEFIKNTYSVCSNISIDYGVMEKAKNVYVFGADFGWSDLGTWNSLYLHSQKDENENGIFGEKVYMKNVESSLIHEVDSQKLVVIKGLDNYLVADTKNVLLICPRENEEKIKQLVIEALANKGEEFA